MEEVVFHGWDNFYLMIGSAAGALIGLLFVVVTLTTGFERSQASRGQAIYMTPTAVHFGVVLTTSAVALVPRLPASAVAVLFALGALCGLVKAVQSGIGIRTGIPGAEPPHWTDAWFYGVFPGVLYLGLLASSVAIWRGAAWAAYGTAFCLMVLLLIGIRDAWDLVTWIAPMTKGNAP